MSHRTNVDNIYPQGTRITARENPTVELIISKYYQRIYYCTVVDNPDQKQRVYFERELIVPE